MKRKWLELERNKLIELLNNNYTSAQIAIVLNRTKRSIDHRRIQLNKKCSKLNENFFENIDTEAKAYFLGLMFSDGCINIPKYGQKRMMISLHWKDKNILEKFKEYLKYENKLIFNEISKRKYKFNIQDQYCLKVSSNKLCNDLIKHGCVPRKSLILEWPKTVPEHLLRHFVRGLFDGDGCIRTKKPSRGTKLSYNFDITGTLSICQGINLLFDKIFNFGLKKLGQQKRKAIIYRYYLGGNNQLKNLYHYLYNNSNIFLNRKHEIFKRILSN